MWLGITNSQDTEVVISREKLTEVIKKFSDKKQEIHLIFDLNKDREARRKWMYNPAALPETYQQGLH